MRERWRRRGKSYLFDEWLAYAELEPFGSRADDLRLAYQLATLSNTIGGGRVVQKDRPRVPYRTEDFLLRYTDRASAKPKPKEKRMSPEATREYVAGIMAVYGGRDPRYPDAGRKAMRVEE